MVPAVARAPSKSRCSTQKRNLFENWDDGPIAYFGPRCHWRGGDAAPPTHVACPKAERLSRMQLFSTFFQLFSTFLKKTFLKLWIRFGQKRRPSFNQGGVAIASRLLVMNAKKWKIVSHQKQANMHSHGRFCFPIWPAMGGPTSQTKCQSPQCHLDH